MAGNVTYHLALGKNELNNDKMTNFVNNKKKMTSSQRLVRLMESGKILVAEFSRIMEYSLCHLFKKQPSPLF